MMTDAKIGVQKENRDFESQNKEPDLGLKEVITKLKEGSDIEGAVLVDEKDDIIACALPDSTRYDSEIQEIMAQLEELGNPVISKTTEGFFTQRIFDYHGLKILAKKLKNKLTLLVILQKRGYVSLAMLDIENSTRKIHEILQGNWYQGSPN
jgi:predicted regulator of Ras-like GTPase activity (Roadblock/LC7/MglB family)